MKTAPLFLVLMYRIRSLNRTPLKITCSILLRTTLRSHSTSFRSGHITRNIQFSPRLGLHPNFSFTSFHSSPSGCLSPMLNSYKIQDILLFGQNNYLSGETYFSFTYRAKPLLARFINKKSEQDI